MLTHKKLIAAMAMIAALSPSAMAWQAKPVERPKLEIPKDDPADPPEVDPRAFTYTVDEAINLFLARVAKNPQDNIMHQKLGELYEHKAELTGDLTYYEKAEVELRKALELFPQNHRAQVALAAVLCSRHRFTEGLELARKALKTKPKDMDALATAGDALLETGRYDEAEKAYQDLYTVSKLPPVLSRLANLADLKGNPDEALRLMKKAVDEIVKAGGSTKEAGWFLAREAEIALNAGRMQEAESLYASVPPGIDAYHDALAGLGRIKAMQGKDAEAIALYEKAVAIGPDPHMLAALGDLYIASGRSKEAEPLFEKLLQITAGKAEYLRERSKFLADHDRDLPKALALAEEDLIQRKDVYGYDALAWAYFKNGKLEEAEKAAKEASKLGTQDAILDYHAGMIAMKKGDRGKARDLLKKALEKNPRVSILHADEARKALEALR